MARSLVGEQLDLYVVGHGMLEQVDHVAVVGYRDRLLLVHSLAGETEGLVDVGGNLLHPALAVAGLDARSVYLGDDGCGAGYFGGLGLSAAHASETGAYEEVAGEITVLRHSELHASGVEERVERAVNDALRTDVHPSAGGHLAVVGHSELHGFVPVVEVVEKTHHHGVGDDDARSVLARGEEAEGMTRFDHERLLVGHLLEIFLDEAVLEPVLAYLTGLAVGYEFVGIEGDVEAEVVVDHHLESLACEAFSFVFVDRLGLEVALGTPAVGVDASAGAELFQKFRSHLFVELLGEIAESVL